MKPSYLLKFSQLLICIGVLLHCKFAIAQSEPTVVQASSEKQDSTNSQADKGKSRDDASEPLSWREAIKQVGVQDVQQADRVASSLRAALRSSERSEVVACALILQCVNRGDVEATKAALAGIRGVFPEPSIETLSFIARVRLWLWFVSDDPRAAQYATSTFREIVTNTHRGELPKSELRGHAKLIGTVYGMLSSNLAESPISQDIFKVAQQCMEASKSADIRSQFNQARQSAVARAEALTETIKSIGGKDPVLVADEQAARKLKLSELGYEFTNTRDLMLEMVRNSREVARQNTLDRRKLAEHVKKLDREWMIPTQGHPGQPPAEPRIPQKSQIKVDEYETKFDGYETETDSDGNKYKVRKEKRERRNQSDIDRERDGKFAVLMAEYNVVKADFDRRIAIYVPLLKSWVEADRVRRLKLQADRAAAEARSQELLETNKQLLEEATEAKSEFREQRSEVEVLAEEYELTDIALRALAAQYTSSAFRPPYFELIDVEEEKFRILGRIKK